MLCAHMHLPQWRLHGIRPKTSKNHETKHKTINKYTKTIKNLHRKSKDVAPNSPQSHDTRCEGLAERVFAYPPGATDGAHKRGDKFFFFAPLVPGCRVFVSKLVHPRDLTWRFKTTKKQRPMCLLPHWPPSPKISQVQIDSDISTFERQMPDESVIGKAGEEAPRGELHIQIAHSMACFFGNSQQAKYFVGHWEKFWKSFLPAMKPLFLLHQKTV